MDSEPPVHRAGEAINRQRGLKTLAFLFGGVGVISVMAGLFSWFQTETYPFYLGAGGGVALLISTYLFVLNILFSRLVGYHTAITPQNPRRDQKQAPPVSETCLLLPTLNEVPTLQSVITGFKQEGFTNILVIDGGSTDGTVDVAEDCGARVVQQQGSGKGQAVREAIEEHIESTYVVMCDADQTYEPKHARYLLAPVADGRADHVIANRFSVMEPGAMHPINKLGNWMINLLFRFLFRVDYGDILSGYRSFTRESFLGLDLTAEGFTIESNIAVELAKERVRTGIVPSRYAPRPADSKTNLRPATDGPRICAFLLKQAYETTPFASAVAAVSTALFLAGVGYIMMVAGAANSLSLFWLVWMLSSGAIALALIVNLFMTDTRFPPHRVDIPRVDHAPPVPVGGEPDEPDSVEKP
jgi:dolichol-phosphate mannosyltransferase